MNWALFACAAYLAVACVSYISQVGKPRDPISASMAAAQTPILGALCVLMVLAGLRLT